MENADKIIRYFYSTDERPEADLEAQMVAARVLISKEIECPLKPYQQDALVSLVADLCGGLAFGKEGPIHNSRLVLAVNAGMLQIAASEFFTYTYIRGRVDRRLWQKRNVERVLFLRGTLNLPLDK